MAISPVGGATHANSTGTLTTLSVTYSPTLGNTIVVGIGTVGAGTVLTTGMSVKDSSNNSLTAGPTNNDATATTGQIFYYTAVSGITSFTASWTNAANVSLVVEEYSGALGGVNGTNGAATFNAVSPCTVTINATQTSSVVAGFLYFPSSTSLGTLTSGNSRQTINVAFERCRFADITSGNSGTASTLSNTVPNNSDSIAAAVELLPNAGGGAGPSNNSLMLMGCGV